ncbi:hypothetical protein LCGC14_0412630 [marine sediment metagenome]|uniref:Uncharacterized protein n=1 Tax=marine sediment metagenome TaxID=412755 RepID=A0A0F9TBJ3_9ZZZZ
MVIYIVYAFAIYGAGLAMWRLGRWVKARFIRLLDDRGIAGIALVYEEDGE